MDKIVTSPIQGGAQGVNPDLSHLVILGSGLGCTQNITVNKEVILPPEEVFSAGGLPRFKDMWKTITTDPVTLDAVSGLTIPFRDLPPCRLPTQEELSSVNEDPVVDASIAELLALKAAAVVPSNTEGFYSKVFTVPKMERGVEYARRFIINLKVSLIIYIRITVSTVSHFIMTETVRVSEFRTFLCQLKILWGILLVTLHLQSNL